MHTFSDISKQDQERIKKYAGRSRSNTTESKIRPEVSSEPLQEYKIRTLLVFSSFPLFFLPLLQNQSVILLCSHCRHKKNYLSTKSFLLTTRRSKLKSFLLSMMNRQLKIWSLKIGKSPLPFSSQEEPLGWFLAIHWGSCFSTFFQERKTNNNQGAKWIKNKNKNKTQQTNKQNKQTSKTNKKLPWILCWNHSPFFLCWGNGQSVSGGMGC